MYYYVKLFHGEASKLQKRFNDWLDSRPNEIIVEMKFQNDLDNGKGAILVLCCSESCNSGYTIPKIQIIFGKANKLENKINNWINEIENIDINNIEFQYNHKGKSSALIHYYTN
jgi:hypothetical protein